MFAMWTQFGILLLACVYLGVVGAPFNSEGNLGTDLELNAGFFEGDMDIKYTPDGKLQPTQRWPLATVYYKIDKKKFSRFLTCDIIFSPLIQQRSHSCSSREIYSAGNVEY